MEETSRRGSGVWWILGMLTAAMLAIPIGGCADLEAVRAFRTDVVALRDSFDAQAAGWQETLETLPPDDPTRPMVAAEKAQAEAAAAAMNAGLARIDEVIAEAAQPTDPISQTVGAASPLLPMPLRGPFLLGAAAVVVGLRAWRLKAGLASVAKSLSAAMREDEEFKQCFTRHANTFRSMQTPTAKRVIDEATGNKPMVALPI